MADKTASWGIVLAVGLSAISGLIYIIALMFSIQARCSMPTSCLAYSKCGFHSCDRAMPFASQHLQYEHAFLEVCCASSLAFIPNMCDFIELFRAHAHLL